MLGDIDEKVAKKTEGCQHVNVVLSKGIVKINKNILFKGGTADFSDDRDAWGVLNDVAVALKAIDETFKTEGVEVPNDAFELGGHTSGDPAANDQSTMQLSNLRASVCREYLLEQGCTGAMLTAKGYGSTKPLSDQANTEEEERIAKTKTAATEFIEQHRVSAAKFDEDAMAEVAEFKKQLNEMNIEVESKLAKVKLFKEGQDLKRTTELAKSQKGIDDFKTRYAAQAEELRAYQNPNRRVEITFQHADVVVAKIKEMKGGIGTTDAELNPATAELKKQLDANIARARDEHSASTTQLKENAGLKLAAALAELKQQLDTNIALERDKHSASATQLKEEALTLAAELAELKKQLDMNIASGEHDKQQEKAKLAELKKQFDTGVASATDLDSKQLESDLNVLKAERDAAITSASANAHLIAQFDALLAHFRSGKFDTACPLLCRLFHLLPSTLASS